MGVLISPTPWTNPYVGPLVSGSSLNIEGGTFDLWDGLPNVFSVFSTTGTNLVFVPARTWQIGVLASSVDVTVSLANARNLTIEIRDQALNVIGGDILLGVVGTQTFNFPIIGQVADLREVKIISSGSYSAGDSVDNIVVNTTAITSEFWTDFVKSYEIP